MKGAVSQVKQDLLDAPFLFHTVSSPLLRRMEQAFPFIKEYTIGKGLSPYYVLLSNSLNIDIVSLASFFHED